MRSTVLVHDAAGESAVNFKASSPLLSAFVQKWLRRQFYRGIYNSLSTFVTEQTDYNRFGIKQVNK